MKRIMILTSHDNNPELNEANLGVTALVITAIDTIRKYIPDAEFVTPGQFSKTFCAQYGLKVIPGTVYNYKVLSLTETVRSFMLLIRSLLWAFFRRFFKRDIGWLVEKQLLKQMRRADAVIVFIHDTYSDNRRTLSVIEHILEMSTAFLLNQNVMVWNSSIGPLRKWFTKRVGQALFKRAAAVTVRETKSLEMLRQAGIENPNISAAPDTVFLLKPASKSRVDEILENESVQPGDAPFIGVCVGREFPMAKQEQGSWGPRIARQVYRFMEYCLPDMLAYKLACLAEKKRLASPHTIAQKKALARLVDYLAENFDATILLISHIILPEKEGYTDMRDERIDAKAVFDMVKDQTRVRLLKGVYTTEEVKGVVGRCDMLMGARMHICVASVSQSVPTLAITYNYKFYGMMAYVGQEQWVCDRISVDEIKPRLRQMWDERDRIRLSLKEHMTDVNRDALAHARIVADLMT